MTETVSICDLCGGDLSEASPVYVFNDFPLVRCAGCRLVLTNPRPTRDEISNFYGNGYYSFLPSGTPSFKQRVKDAVVAELGDYPTSTPGWPKWILKVAAPLLRAHIMVVPPHVPKGRLLDAGCGSGSFLRWALRMGWEATGLEVDARAVEEARRVGLPVVHGAMEDCAFPDETFDTVVLNHALEHCHNPTRVLGQCQRVLRPGGLLIVGVPNFDCYDNQVFADCWSNCEAPRHLYHFNPETLTSFLEKQDFSLERLRYKKWFIPHSERISFRFLRRKVKALPWTRRAATILSARIRIQVLKKLALLLGLRPDRELGQMMTAYARKPGGYGRI